MEGAETVPTLLMIVGAPAVGKMTVGRAVAARTGFRLFHNHASIEPVLPIFGFGHPAFIRIVEAFRHSVLSEAANSDLPGIIFTFAWAFGHPGEQENVDERTAPFRERGGRVVFLELSAPLEVRLERNATAERLAEKPSKRDLEDSRRVLLEHEASYRFTTEGEMDGRSDWLRVDNANMSPDEVAEIVIDHFSLPRAER